MAGNNLIAAAAISLLILSVLPAICTVGNEDGFISARCSLATYPPLCRASLSSYANKVQSSPGQLAQVAVSVSLSHAKTAVATTTSMAGNAALKPGEAMVLNDCIMTLGDSVVRLQKSRDEMGSARDWADDARTWVSAALTDANMCADELGGVGLGGKRDAVRAPVVRLAMLTSNALALISNMASVSPAAAEIAP